MILEIRTGRGSGKRKFPRGGKQAKPLKTVRLSKRSEASSEILLGSTRQKIPTAGDFLLLVEDGALSHSDRESGSRVLSTIRVKRRILLSNS